jgi:hypothetical protein
MEDLIEQANEIQESLGRSYAVPDEIDEADLEAGMFDQISYPPLTLSYFVPELDALALEPPEEEGPSYLADLNKVPDFIDEAPIEVGEVGKHPLLNELSIEADIRHPDQKPSRQRVNQYWVHFVLSISIYMLS